MIAKKKAHNMTTIAEPHKKLKTLKVGVIDLTTQKVNKKDAMYATSSSMSSVKSLKVKTPTKVTTRVNSAKRPETVKVIVPRKLSVKVPT